MGGLTTGPSGPLWQLAVVDGPSGVPRLLLNLPVPEGAPWEAPALLQLQAQGLTPEDLHDDSEFKRVDAFSAALRTLKSYGQFVAWHPEFVQGRLEASSPFGLTSDVERISRGGRWHAAEAVCGEGATLEDIAPTALQTALHIRNRIQALTEETP